MLDQEAGNHKFLQKFLDVYFQMHSGNRLVLKMAIEDRIKFWEPHCWKKNHFLLFSQDARFDRVERTIHVQTPVCDEGYQKFNFKRTPFLFEAQTQEWPTLNPTKTRLCRVEPWICQANSLVSHFNQL